MRIDVNMKKIIKIAIVIVVIIIYCIPIITICCISDKEIQEYVEDQDFTFQEMAYGSIMKAEHMDIKEYYSFKAKVISNEEVVVKISNGTVDLNVQEGDEVYKGDVLARSKGTAVKSSCNGIVNRIEYGEVTILYIENFEDLALECKVTEDKLDIFEEKFLLDENEKKLKIIRKSNMMEDGFFNIVLELPSKGYYYGQEFEKIRLYTGNIYRKSLVLDKRCVYKKESDGKWYVRKVTKEGVFLEEVEVQIGYESNDKVCITGIDEGTYCDSGYKTMISGEKSDEDIENKIEEY